MNRDAATSTFIFGEPACGQDCSSGSCGEGCWHYGGCVVPGPHEVHRCARCAPEHAPSTTSTSTSTWTGAAPASDYCRHNRPRGSCRDWKCQGLPPARRA